MDVHPIRTKADHQAALIEIASLMGAKKDSPQGDRLDVLVTLVEAYEAAITRIEAPDPIRAILFMMEQKQLSRRDLEPAIGICRALPSASTGWMSATAARKAA